MNARLKPVRTANELASELATVEQSLTDAKRAHERERRRMPNLIAMGDADAITECKQLMAAHASKTKEFAEAIESIRDAICIARELDLAAVNAEALRTIEKRDATLIRDVAAFEETIISLGKSLARMRASVAAKEDEVARCGLPRDPDIMARLLGKADMLLYLESDGFFGNSRTLDTPHQLRQNGMASLKLAVNEYSIISMRRARNALSVSP